MTADAIRLKKNEDRRLKAGHLWVFSNEVDTQATPLTDFTPGAPVRIEAHSGKVLGVGYVNPHSLIAARLVSRNPKITFDQSLLVHRIKVALGLRERLFAKPFYRLVYGEADGLPGLIVDRFGDQLVVQCSTAGMEAQREAIVGALVKVLKPAGILLRNDLPVRELEGLDEYVEVAHGEVPERVELEENGLRFLAPLHAGQKTGWFYDQRDNRARLGRYVAGKRVLDVFSYLGGWGVLAAARGASEVVCVDSSESALDLAGENATLNGVEIGTVEGDAFEALKALRDNGEKFDVVVVDPPAFIKRKRDIKQGEKAYHRITQLALRLLNRDGILVSASCSHHLPRRDLERIVLGAARHTDRVDQLLEVGEQAPDHPVHPAIPETAYLKAIYTRILPAD